jgi:hypothetical protein
MTDPQGAVTPYPASNPVSSAQVEPYNSNTRVIEPTAVAGPRSAAVHALGEVLKTMIHNAHYFPTENLVDAAMNTVDKWVAASTSSSEIAAIITGNERAPKEDVTKRTPPGGSAMPVAGPAIDYRLLAEAIVAAQNRKQLEG